MRAKFFHLIGSRSAYESPLHHYTGDLALRTRNKSSRADRNLANSDFDERWQPKFASWSEFSGCFLHVTLSSFLVYWRGGAVHIRPWPCRAPGKAGSGAWGLGKLFGNLLLLFLSGMGPWGCSCWPGRTSLYPLSLVPCPVSWRYTFTRITPHMQRNCTSSFSLSGLILLSREEGWVLDFRCRLVS